MVSLVFSEFRSEEVEEKIGQIDSNDERVKELKVVRL